MVAEVAVDSWSQMSSVGMNQDEFGYGGLLQIPTLALREEDPTVPRMAASLPLVPEDEP